MYKSAIRAAPRRILSSQNIASATRRRLLSTAPPTQESRSWKSSAARWGLVAAGIYWYNTSTLFAEEPEAAIQSLNHSIHHVQDSDKPTIDAIVEEKRQREAQRLAEEHRKQLAAEAALASKEGETDDKATIVQPDGDGAEGEGGLDGLEEEADQQGAFNPETGEINWDCPCLGGMAHGPCGEEFKVAFSCFVYSDQEPKGVECIDKFQGMQNCFRAHPEMYGSELDDDEDEVEEELRAREAASLIGEGRGQPTPKDSPEPGKEPTAVTEKKETTPAPEKKEPLPEIKRESNKTTAEEAQKSADESNDLVPKAVHDATSK